MQHFTRETCTDKKKASKKQEFLPTTFKWGTATKMRHIRAAINFRDMAGRALVEALKFVCKKLRETWPGSAAILLETRGSPGKPGRLKDRERHGICDKDEKFCKWNTNFHWEVSTRKTGLPFQKFRLFRKISSGTNQKVVFHLHPNRNFRNF